MNVDTQDLKRTAKMLPRPPSSVWSIMEDETGPVTPTWNHWVSHGPVGSRGDDLAVDWKAPVKLDCPLDSSGDFTFKYFKININPVSP